MFPLFEFNWSFYFSPFVLRLCIVVDRERRTSTDGSLRFCLSMMDRKKWIKFRIHHHPSFSAVKQHNVRLGHVNTFRFNFHYCRVHQDRFVSRTRRTNNNYTWRYGESVDEKSPNQNNKKKYGNATYLHGMIYFNRLVHLDGSRRAFSAARENCN